MRVFFELIIKIFFVFLKLFLFLKTSKNLQAFGIVSNVRAFFKIKVIEIIIAQIFHSNFMLPLFSNKSSFGIFLTVLNLVHSLLVLYWTMKSLL